MSIGDLDSLDRWLEDYDIILASTEKLDSLIRHGLNWLDSIGCIVIDEIHMLDEEGRGPTLEILISKLKRMCTDAQILALSATVGNSKELAEWMVCRAHRERLPTGAAGEGHRAGRKGDIRYGREEELDSKNRIPEIRVTEDTIRKGKQIIIFYGTKRNAEAGAERLSRHGREDLSSKTRSSSKD